MKNNKYVLNYSNIFYILLILLILLCIFYNNVIFSSFLSYTIIFFLLVPFFNDPIILFFTSFIIIILLNMLPDKTYNLINSEINIENFDIDDEDEENKKNNNELKSEKKNNEINQKINNLVDKLSTIDDENSKIKEDDLNSMNNIPIKELKNTIKNNINDHDLDYKKKDTESMEPYQAQKETFELINSVQNLQDTVKTLGPLLKEGRKVLDLYKNFKF